ncbi:MAG TPA: ATP-dependent DNA helicase RecG, partial [Anaerolineae bacterium]|nr:ATP-dependent DNA helicase RecG [Anaerolineae bacterium]
MPSAFERLGNVLRLEKEQGFHNKAVVGGIRQFATFWVGQARDEIDDDIDLFFVEQVAETLTQYNKLPSRAARRDTIENILLKLAERGRRKQGVRGERPEKQEKIRVVREVVEKPRVKKVVEKVAKIRPKPAPPTIDPPTKPVTPDPVGLTQPITVIKGVGPKMAELINKVGPQTVRDLLYLHPRRYDDYSKMKTIRQLEYGEVVTVIGTLWTVRSRRTRNNQVAVHAVLGDGSGKVQLNFYNQRWLEKSLKVGAQYAISGKVDQYLGRPVFNSPEFELIDAENLKSSRIVPVYPLTKGLSANRLRKIMQETVNRWAARVPDPLPESIRAKHRFLRLSDALSNIHFPRGQEFQQAAQRRLAFDELFLLQLGMLHQRSEWQEMPAQPLEAHVGERIRFFNTLPFEPTNAQKRVIEEIAKDMAGNVPMNRLLQGDVGAGKTLVAAAAMITAVKSGAQVALMAPTEILAEQHFSGLGKLLAPLGISLRLLTGSVSAANKRQVYAAAADGSADILIGTTALIQPTLAFKNLGFVVIDEQHRFGVDQRGALRGKGQGEFNPHLLVMTATPIPRSLALTLYGDLDVSILDEMPPGRQEILTRWLRESERERAYGFIRRQAAEGRQAYIIFPLVEESDKSELKAAVDEHKRLQEHVFPKLKLGLLHGKMKSAEKEAAMRAFYAGETDVLVSTTVVEVGVDVPNATVMMIEGANRFGLAQLHQLRGRVGRGQYKSYCILISDSTTTEAIERLTALEDTNDGFQLAEKDLELRGPGEFFGRRQSGLP